MTISAGLVKELRERTGIGMMECKKALEESNGDIEKAKEIEEVVGIVVNGFLDLTSWDQQEIEDIRAELGTRFCRQCEYCLPCPEGLKIPTLMRIVYLNKYLEASKQAAQSYKWQVDHDNSPAKCTQCGQCEEKCTQHLHITEELKYLLDKFDKN